MRDHRKLRVWQDAHRLALELYADTRSFPVDERFGLTRQMRRAAASIPMNMSEGAGRSSRAVYARFLDIATASANEVDYQLLLARDLAYLDESLFRDRQSKVIAIRRRLAALRRAVLDET
jgi:four helix bundle protein